MARRLPPLNALRAFEAAARHLSFTKAADELAVTQAAISHQVKGLEDRLGVALFRRANRALVLTEVGQAYLPALRDAFDAIDAATARILQKDKAGTITVTTMPSFGAAWLVREALEALLPDGVEAARWVDLARRARSAWGRGGEPRAARRPLLLTALTALYEAR